MTTPTTGTTALDAFVERVINQGDFDAVLHLVSPDFVDEDVCTGELRGDRAFLMTLFQEMRQAMPDLHFELELAVDDAQGCSWRMYKASGTMLGPRNGRVPTGRRAKWTEMHWASFNDQGQMNHHKGTGDDLGQLQQLGILPVDQMALYQVWSKGA